jgi:hypothetical protein
MRVDTFRANVSQNDLEWLSLREMGLSPILKRSAGHGRPPSALAFAQQAAWKRTHLR